MILIVGLGNPGEKYQFTRHNLGFLVIERFAKKQLPLPETRWENNSKFEAEIIKVGQKMILVKPDTFMNESGKTVAKIASFYQIAPAEIWIIHDDVDLPLGRIKIRLGGASAGHRGVESVIRNLGTADFFRFRLGVGLPKEVGGEKEIETYVLREFESNETSTLKQVVKNTVAALNESLKNGVGSAMNRYNN